MADQPRIREFESTDAAAFRALNEAWLNKYFRVEPKDVKVLGDPQGQIVEPGGVILVHDLAGLTIGCCALIKMPDDAFEVAKMAIDEAHQGKGHGRLLLDACIERARAIGAKRLYLESNSRLVPALRLYGSVGFRDLPEHQRPASAYERVDVWMEMWL